nr:hypothetical protein JVH1_6965 [Rhodococcus sp. JVH1]
MNLIRCGGTMTFVEEALSLRHALPSRDGPESRVRCGGAGTGVFCSSYRCDGNRLVAVRILQALPMAIGHNVFDS